MKRRSTSVVQRFADSVRLPATALTVVGSSLREQGELLVWVDASFRDALQALPASFDGFRVHAEIRPTIVARAISGTGNGSTGPVQQAGDHQARANGPARN